ncbi:methyltransferase domain-containing protein [Psychrosphaera haliotis]|nr:methyltransferase domain-containing protein [Psychrosphaera haliotis]
MNKLKLDLTNSSLNAESVKQTNQSAVKRFEQSASTYKQKARLQKDTGRLLLKRIDEALVKSQDSKPFPLLMPDFGLDLGCGPGLFTNELAKRCHYLTSSDLSMAMLHSNDNGAGKVCADSHSLPFQTNSIDWCYSSLMVQWCDFESVVREALRAVKPGGVVAIATLLPGSLFELESAWKEVDSGQHIHQYQTEFELKQALSSLDFNKLSTSKKDFVYWYKDAMALAKELKSLGANFVKQRSNKGLVSLNKWRDMESNYKRLFFNLEKQALPATYCVQTIVITK